MKKTKFLKVVQPSYKVWCMSLTLIILRCSGSCFGSGIHSSSFTCSKEHKHRKEPVQGNCQEYMECSLKFPNRWYLQRHKCSHTEQFDEIAKTCVPTADVSITSKCHPSRKIRTTDVPLASSKHSGLGKVNKTSKGHVNHGLHNPQSAHPQSFVISKSSKTISFAGTSGITDITEGGDYESLSDEPQHFKIKSTHLGRKTSKSVTSRPSPSRAHKTETSGTGGSQNKGNQNQTQNRSSIATTISPKLVYGRTFINHIKSPKLGKSSQTSASVTTPKPNLTEPDPRGNETSPSKGDRNKDSYHNQTSATHDLLLITSSSIVVGGLDLTNLTLNFSTTPAPAPNQAGQVTTNPPVAKNISSSGPFSTTPTPTPRPNIGQTNGSKIPRSPPRSHNKNKRRKITPGPGNAVDKPDLQVAVGFLELNAYFPKGMNLTRAKLQLTTKENAKRLARVNLLQRHKISV